MPPTPLKCSMEECEYTTPTNCPDWDKMLKLLELHTSAVHGVAPAPGVGARSSAPRLEKLPRPSFSLEMTQSEWSFKESQWSAYISQSVVPEAVKVQQLQAACDQDLLRRVYDAGGMDTLITEQMLLAQVKKLAVRVVHKTLHMQNMWSMTQSPEEPVRAFCSRLAGTAELCPAPAAPVPRRTPTGTGWSCRPSSKACTTSTSAPGCSPGPRTTS